MMPCKTLKIILLTLVFTFLNWFIVASRPLNQSDISKHSKPELGFGDECDAIEVKVDIIHASGNNREGEITLTFKRPSNEFTCFLFSDDSTENQLEIRETKIKNLLTGEYNLYIQNKEGCTKHLKITI